MVSVVPCPSCGLKNPPDRADCFRCGADLGVLTLPLHLAPFLLPTPSSAAKLMAAWDGLSAESQMLILTKLKTTPRPECLSTKILAKALDSTNAYVRYLAAGSLRGNGDDAVKQRIEKDPDPLVRYCPLETPETGYFLSDPETLKDAAAFFALPHEARLAVVRNVVTGGEEVAKIISHAIDNELIGNNVSEIELYEILCDYMKKPAFRDYYDSYGDRHRFDYPLSELGDIRALWKIVPELSEAISYVLIENLPGQIAGNSAIPDEVLKQLNPRQVNALLRRSDVGLEEFRKQIFWTSAPHDLLFNTAAFHNFNLGYKEFARILEFPAKERAEVLFYLLSVAEDLSPYLYEALCDALFASDEHAGDYGFPNDLKKSARNLQRLRGWQGYEISADTKTVGRELRQDLGFNLKDLALYRAAKEAVPWREGDVWRKQARTDELDFLAKFIVEGDTWRTFVSFHEAWTKEKPHTIEGLLDYLPEWKRPPKVPEELFGDAGREGSFLEDKINFIGKKLLSLSEIREETDETPVSKDPDELIPEKEESTSLEVKIDFIKTKLLFYDEKFETFLKDLRYIVWLVIIVLAVSYGWKLLAGLF